MRILYVPSHEQVHAELNDVFRGTAGMFSGASPPARSGHGLCACHPRLGRLDHPDTTDHLHLPSLSHFAASPLLSFPGPPPVAHDHPYRHFMISFLCHLSQPRLPMILDTSPE